MIIIFSLASFVCIKSEIYQTFDFIYLAFWLLSKMFLYPNCHETELWERFPTSSLFFQRNNKKKTSIDPDFSNWVNL